VLPRNIVLVKRTGSRVTSRSKRKKDLQLAFEVVDKGVSSGDPPEGLAFKPCLWKERGVSENRAIRIRVVRNSNPLVSQF
jgi:hypothetical protein